jgi:hypothetical protein
MPTGLAGLHEQRFVVLERLQRPDDRVERRPAAGGASGSAVNNQILRPLSDLGIQVVHQHAQRGFLSAIPCTTASCLAVLGWFAWPAA